MQRRMMEPCAGGGSPLSFKQLDLRLAGAGEELIHVLRIPRGATPTGGPARGRWEVRRRRSRGGG